MLLVLAGDVRLYRGTLPQDWFEEVVREGEGCHGTGRCLGMDAFPDFEAGLVDMAAFHLYGEGETKMRALVSWASQAVIWSSAAGAVVNSYSAPSPMATILIAVDQSM